MIKLPLLALLPRGLPLAGLLSLSLFTSGGLAAGTNGYVVTWGNTNGNTPPSYLPNVAAVAAGHEHGLALLPDGTVTGWGNNLDGQARPPTGLSGVQAIAAGGYHSLALKSNGTVVAWGQSSAGQVDVPSSLTNATSAVIAVAAGEYFSMALRSNGTVVCWGSIATEGSLGAGTKAIAAGSFHCMALLANGSVVCWGDNSRGQSTRPYPDTMRAKAIAGGGFHSLALRTDGVIVGWGDNTYGQSGLRSYPGTVGIAAGGYFSLALLTNHTVQGWGDTSVGQLDIPSDLTNAVSISAGWETTLALAVLPVVITAHPTPLQSVLVGATVTFSVTAPGGAPIAYQWRTNGVAIPNATNSTYTISNAQTNQSGTYSVLVSNLTAVRISSNAVLQVSLPPAITQQPVNAQTVEGIAAEFTVVAVGSPTLGYQWRKDGVNIWATSAKLRIDIPVAGRDDGAYTCVVTNPYGTVTSQVATLTIYTKPLITTQPQSLTVYAGMSAVFQVGASNATAYQWYKDDQLLSGATSPEYLINQASGGHAGAYKVLVSNPRASVMSAVATLSVLSLPPSGLNVLNLGQLSYWNGVTNVDLAAPAGVGNASVVSLGKYHGLAVLPGGAVVPWGDNSAGQSQPPVMSAASSVAAGGSHSLALTTAGVVGWGANGAPQANPPALTDAIAIAAGGNHSLALRQNGMVVGWGTNSYGQANPPLGVTTRISAIAAGSEHSLALLADGTVIAWGRYQEYQTRTPAELTNAATAHVAAIAAGGYHNMALRSNGTVVCWGSNSDNQTNVPAGLANVVAISAGLMHSLALKQDGTIAAWGANYLGQLDFPPHLSGVTAIAAGGDRSLAIYQKHPVLLSSARRPAGGITLYIGYNDGSPADAALINMLEVRASTDLSVDLGSWVSYTTGFVMSGYEVRWDDPDAAGLTHRYYQLLER
jgi:trimeric autotransporter adhesin